MNRLFVLALALPLLFISCESSSEEVAPSLAGKPNFLFIFADDQAFDTIQALGHPIVQTPNLDRLVQQGMNFTHTFNQGSWSGAVCVVSRAMLNSGRYIYRAREDIDRVPLWGEVFTDAGYETFLTGKWHNGDATATKSFKYGKSIGRGMYETKEGPAGPGYRRPTPENQSWSPTDRSLLGHWSPEVKDIEDTIIGKRMGGEYVVEQHSSELYADRAIQFMESYINMEERGPFFMYVSFNAPHDPRQAPKEYVDLYPLDSLQLPPNFLPEHPFDQGERNTLRDEILAPFPRTEEAIKTHLQEYYAIITHMDHEIGRIMNSLDELGLSDNTYIIFTADHGLAVGQHGLLGKQNQYDHSIRVPLMMAGPGIEPGSTNDALVYLQSVYPTTCELAGLPIPETVEFRSLLPLIEQESQMSYEAIFGSYKHFQRMVRTASHKLVVYPEVDQVHLFDMQQDPYEMNNLAASPAYRDTLEMLYDQLRQLQEEVGDTLQLDLDIKATG